MNKITQEIAKSLRSPFLETWCLSHSGAARVKSILTSLFGVRGERSSLNHAQTPCHWKGLLTNGLTIPSAIAIPADFHTRTSTPCRVFLSGLCTGKWLLVNILGITKSITGPESLKALHQICHLPLASPRRCPACCLVFLTLRFSATSMLRLFDWLFLLFLSPYECIKSL